MKEEITISFEDQTGFRISKCDMATGKVVVNGIEITSVEDWEKVTKSIIDLQSQLKAKEEAIIIMEKYFELIIDLGFDYDGFNKADSLKSLIDELVRFAKLGRACNITEAIYEIENKKFNILHKEILSKGENK